jgi:hypothetical protein
LATAKLAANLSSHSKKLGRASDASRLVNDVRWWASQLAAESRTPGWFAKSYVWPDELSRIWDDLKRMQKGLIGIVGLQGVGKSSALQAIYQRRLEQEDQQGARKNRVATSAPQHAHNAVLFKWRRQTELFKSLLDGSHEASESFISEYLPNLWRRRLSSRTMNNSSENQSLHRLRLLSEESKSIVSLARMAKNDADFYASDVALEEVNRLED